MLLPTTTPTATCAPLTATLGDEEIASGVVKIRNMATREETTVSLNTPAKGVAEILEKLHNEAKEA